MIRRFALLPGVMACAFFATPVIAATAQDDLAANVEAFRKAQVAADANALAALTLPDLSYSHSDARVEDKNKFIANATSGKSTFLSIVYGEPSLRIVGDDAIVRFHWTAEQQMAADGKKVATDLHILMVWHKQAEGWKLLARSATKL